MDQDVETRLRAALRDALKTRDVVAALAVRSALGAIGNAGAVPADVRAIVEAEISERQTTAGQYEQTGHADRAQTLRREAQVLRAVLDG